MNRRVCGCGARIRVGVFGNTCFFVYFFLLVMGSPATRISGCGPFFFVQHFNQSRNRGWGKEGEGGE